MKYMNIEMIVFFLSVFITLIGMIIVVIFVEETISWAMIKLIMVEIVLIFGLLWISKQEQK